MNEFAKRRTWGPTPRYPLVEAYKPPKNDFVVIAGPCSVESKEQLFGLLECFGDLKVTHLRGGVFRAGTYPGKNFGWVSQALIEGFNDLARSYGKENITEILSYDDHEGELSHVLQYTDCVQVGARQMQNYTLLKILGRIKKPVFLKRNPGATLDEWLGAAEYLLDSGCEELYLIERGSVSHVNHVRWDLSLSMIPAVKAICEIPVIVDASHGTGRRDLVEPMTLAGVAAGAGGILVEVHETPEKSLSDPDQAITPDAFGILMRKVNKIREAIK